MELDENGRIIAKGVSSVDLETPVKIKVNPNTNAVLVELSP